MLSPVCVYVQADRTHKKCVCVDKNHCEEAATEESLSVLIPLLIKYSTAYLTA